METLAKQLNEDKNFEYLMQLIHAEEQSIGSCTGGGGGSGDCGSCQVG